MKMEDGKIVPSVNAVPIRKERLKDFLKKGNKIAIGGHVFRVVNIDYLTGSLVLKSIPSEEVFFKTAETERIQQNANQEIEKI